MSLRNLHIVGIGAVGAALVLAGCVLAQTGGTSKADAKKTAAPRGEDAPLPPLPQLNGAQGSPAPAAQLDAPGGGLAETPDLDHGSNEEASHAQAALAQRLERLEKLLESQAAVLEDIRQDLAELRKAAPQRVARQDPGSDPALPQSASELAPVGKLMVENRTLLGYTMAINGAVYLVPPGHRGELRVPVGTVITELRGYEPPKAWKESDWRKVGDEYQLAIQIQ